MQGVTAAIVAFLFVCIIFPSLVKNRPQYYVAMFLVLAAVFLDSLVDAFKGLGPATFFAVVRSGLIVCSILLLVLSTGGLAVRDLAGDIGKTIEVIRRGGEKETIIVPRSGELPKVREPAEKTRISLDD